MGVARLFLDGEVWQRAGVEIGPTEVTGLGPVHAVLMTAPRPKRSYVQQGKYVRYEHLTGRSRISNAKRPL